jgi:hypothetical protein
MDQAQFGFDSYRKALEVFAQLHSVYTFDPEWSKQHAPEFYKLAKEIDRAPTEATKQKLIWTGGGSERTDDPALLQKNNDGSGAKSSKGGLEADSTVEGPQGRLSKQADKVTFG